MSLLFCIANEEMQLFFEGSEKKAEILVDATKLNLLEDVNDEFWAELVKCCHAQILSTISNNDCKAFLLSESSLFVWKDRMLILTCGETRLVKSVEFFLKHFGSDAVHNLFYQRKNEYFAQAQPSWFGDDIKLLSQYVSGKAYRFGELDGHHNFVFHLDNDYIADENDKTYELLAYQISKEASKKLTEPNLTAQEIRDFLQIDTLLPGFKIDDFVFEPYGYSLNAIKDQFYLTIHVTPQAESSYISFESNLNLVALAPQILDVLEPNSYDLMSFNEPNFSAQLSHSVPAGYVAQSLVSETLSNGFLVNFANFICPQNQFAKPVSIDISGENHAL